MRVCCNWAIQSVASRGRERGIEREGRENSNRNEKTRDKIVEFFAWNIFKIRSMFVEYYQATTTTAIIYQQHNNHTQDERDEQWF